MPEGIIRFGLSPGIVVAERFGRRGAEITGGPHDREAEVYIFYGSCRRCGTRSRQGNGHGRPGRIREDRTTPFVIGRTAGRRVGERNLDGFSRVKGIALRGTVPVRLDREGAGHVFDCESKLPVTGILDGQIFRETGTIRHRAEVERGGGHLDFGFGPHVVQHTPYGPADRNGSVGRQGLGESVGIEFHGITLLQGYGNGNKVVPGPGLESTPVRSRQRDGRRPVFDVGDIVGGDNEGDLVRADPDAQVAGEQLSVVAPEHDLLDIIPYQGKLYTPAHIVEMQVVVGRFCDAYVQIVRKRTLDPRLVRRKMEFEDFLRIRVPVGIRINGHERGLSIQVERAQRPGKPGVGCRLRIDRGELAGGIAIVDIDTIRRAPQDIPILLQNRFGVRLSRSCIQGELPRYKGCLVIVHFPGASHQEGHRRNNHPFSFHCIPSS